MGHLSPGSGRAPEPAHPRNGKPGRGGRGRTAIGGAPPKRPGPPERFFWAASSAGNGSGGAPKRLGKMAAPSARCLWRALAPRCGGVFPGLEQRLAVPAVLSPAAARPYAAAAKAAKKDARRSRQEKEKPPPPRRRPLMSKPVDDVYPAWLYRRPSYQLEQALGMLKRFQELDFTHPKQFVYINVFLDMALQKKKKVDPFSSSVTLPHRFTDEVNKVLVFTENVQEAEVAREHGAAIVGGVELMKWILEDEIQADFYVAVPAIIPKLIPLRNKLKRKYPSTRRNSLGSDIPKMLQFFRECHEYTVEDENIIKTRIARLDMPTEHIIANLKTIIHDICTFKPSNFDPIVQRLVIRSSTSEGLLLNLDGILPEVEKGEEKEEGNATDEDQQKPVQESVST